MVAVLLIFFSAAVLPQESRPDSASRPAVSGAHEPVRRDNAQESRRPEQDVARFLQRESLVLDNLLAEIGKDGRAGAGIDSLLRAHPELRSLVLRKLLTPDEPQSLASSASLFTPEGWRLEGNSRMTPFERNGLIMSRQMVLHDRWTENRILLPQADVLGTLLWILSLLR